MTSELGLLRIKRMNVVTHGKATSELSWQFTRTHGFAIWGGKSHTYLLSIYFSFNSSFIWMLAVAASCREWLQIDYAKRRLPTSQLVPVNNTSVCEYWKILFYPSNTDTGTFYEGSTDIDTDAQYSKFDTEILVFPVFYSISILCFKPLIDSYHLRLLST